MDSGLPLILQQQIDALVAENTLLRLAVASMMPSQEEDQEQQDTGGSSASPGVSEMCLMFQRAAAVFNSYGDEMSRPEHIGDGVYIQHDPHTGDLVLTTGRHLPTEEHPGSPPDNVVVMEHWVLVSFLKWMEKNDPDMRHFLWAVTEGNSLDEL